MMQGLLNFLQFVFCFFSPGVHNLSKDWNTVCFIRKYSKRFSSSAKYLGQKFNFSQSTPNFTNRVYPVTSLWMLGTFLCTNVRRKTLRFLVSALLQRVEKRDKIVWTLRTRGNHISLSIIFFWFAEIWSVRGLWTVIMEDGNFRPLSFPWKLF